MRCHWAGGEFIFVYQLGEVQSANLSLCQRHHLKSKEILWDFDSHFRPQALRPSKPLSRLLALALLYYTSELECPYFELGVAGRGGRGYKFQIEILFGLLSTSLRLVA